MMKRKQPLEFFLPSKKSHQPPFKAASRNAKAASLWAISLLSLQIKTFVAEARRWKFLFITLTLSFSLTHTTRSTSLSETLHFVARLFSSTWGEKCSSAR